jgi:hypothetical protein
MLILLNSQTLCCISLYDCSVMTPWMKKSGHIVFQEHGCVMATMTALMEKTKMLVHVAGKIYMTKFVIC